MFFLCVVYVEEEDTCHSFLSIVMMKRNRAEVIIQNRAYTRDGACVESFPGEFFFSFVFVIFLRRDDEK